LDCGARPDQSELNSLEPESDHMAYFSCHWSKKATDRSCATRIGIRGCDLGLAWQLPF